MICGLRFSFMSQCHFQPVFNKELMIMHYELYVDLCITTEYAQGEKVNKMQMKHISTAQTVEASQNEQTEA